MDGMQIFRFGNMSDAQLVLPLTLRRALAESGVRAVRRSPRRNSNAVHLRRFSYSQTSWLLTRGGSEVLGKSRLPPSIPKRRAFDGPDSGAV